MTANSPARTFEVSPLSSEEQLPDSERREAKDGKRIIDNVRGFALVF